MLVALPPLIPHFFCTTNSLRYSARRSAGNRDEQRFESRPCPELKFTNTPQPSRSDTQRHILTFVSCRTNNFGRCRQNVCKHRILCLNNARLYFHAIITSHNCKRNRYKSVESSTSQLISNFHCPYNFSIQ